MQEQKFPRLWHCGALVFGGTSIFVLSIVEAAASNYGSHPLTALDWLLSAGLVVSGAMFFTGLAMLLMWFVSKASQGG